MKTTTDTFTGKPFRWNCTTEVHGVTTPAYETTRAATYLHPDRVPADLLNKLNRKETPVSITNPFDSLTAELTAFGTFEELLDTSPNYRPTIYPRDERHVALANAYDAAQLARGDARRAYRGQVDTTPVAVILPRNELVALVNYFDQHVDEILDAGAVEVQNAVTRLTDAS